ncbi:MAG: hypothetical protein ABSB15_08980 [Bryobacteraceae bacterium]|jgi:hypothetical protein
MSSSVSEWVCPAAELAKSLLEVWLSGDRYRLRLELERISLIEELPATSDESDRIDLLKNLARRMKESSDLFTPRGESPRVGIWLDLLDHLSAADPRMN